MVETSGCDDVGRAFDRALASGRPIANGLGRHDNDEMFSFYVVSPAGFQVEVGHGARVVGDDWSDNRRYSRISRGATNRSRRREPMTTTRRRDRRRRADRHHLGHPAGTARATRSTLLER